jgi:glycosyltransferase involved in cell wall biosynthesis
MKVVVNAYSARIGGGQTYLRHLLAHLPDRPDLEVIVFGPPSLPIPPGSAVRRADTRWPTTNVVLRTLWERLRLPAILRRERADVLFCPGGVVATTAPPGCRVVTMFRNMIPFDAPLVARMPWGLQKLRNRLLRRAMLHSMARADLTIFISTFARQLIEGLVAVRRAVTIPHGIDAAFRAGGTVPPRPPLAPKGEYLLYVSRFDPYKHHREVVEGFAALPPAIGAGLHLVLVGEDDRPEAAAVRARVRELGLQERARIVGAIPYASLPAWYRHARAIVFASSCENCPNILLESLGAGRPVICSEVMPMPEFGGPGLAYFAPTEPASLTRALTDVLGSTARSQAVAAAATERSRHYDWAATAEATWTQILALARGTGQRPAA